MTDKPNAENQPKQPSEAKSTTPPAPTTVSKPADAPAPTTPPAPTTVSKPADAPAPTTPPAPTTVSKPVDAPAPTTPPAPTTVSKPADAPAPTTPPTDTSKTRTEEVSAARKALSEKDLSEISALVVEDDAGGMAIIGVMMRFLNIKAYINTNGEGVLSMARAMRPRPDIVFCDINLPRTTGYDVLKELRADPDFKDIMVIAVTAQDADTEIPKAREAGFNGYIGKPLNRMRFPKQLRRILAGEEVWETY